MEYVYSNKPIDLASDNIADEIIDRLDLGESILLLLSGGSAIELAVKISMKVNAHNLSKLYVTLVDERYGELNHVDENWSKLIDAGFISGNSNIYRPLINKDAINTVKKYDEWLTNNLDKCDYRLGIFGIGSDGHTAGIKPGSPVINSRNNVDYYMSNDYERVTITPSCIEKLDKAIVYAAGDDKRNVLNDFVNTDSEIATMPAQVLKLVPKLMIYTNNKQEELL